MEEVRVNFSAKDLFNTSNAKSLNDLEDGTELTVDGMCLIEKPDKDGVVKPVCYFKAGDTIYGTISNSVIASAIAMPELMAEGEALTIRVVKRKSANNRKYNLIELV